MVRKAGLCLAAWCLLVPGMVSGEEPLAADEAYAAETSDSAPVTSGSDSVSTRTTEQKEAARATLGVVREELLPGRLVDSPMGLQSLPGESSFRETVREISEIDEIKPGRPLTLQEALLMADAQNIDLEAARIKIELAQAQLKQAWALLMPNISATLQWVHLGQVPSFSLGGLGDALSGMGTLLGKMGLAMVASGMLRPEDLEDLAGLGGGDTSGSMAMASQDTVNFGITVGLSIINVAGWFQLRMLDEAKHVTELGVENGRQALLAGVAQIYLAALLTGEVVKIQRVQLISALDQLALAQGRFERGVDVRLSVIQAQFGVEQARQALIDAIWSYETARDALAIILNTEGLPVPQPTTIRGLENMTDEALEDEAIQQNRVLQMNRATQHIQTLNLNAAIAGFFPTLSGAWQYSYTLTEVTSMSAQKSSWTLALSLNIPLFDYSKYGLLDERRAALRETQLQFESTQRSTKQAVRKAKREYFSSIFAVDNAKRQVELATEALLLTEAAYANGVSTFIDLSNARNRAAAASMAHVTSQIQANLALISLISSLGRDIMEIVY